MVSRRLTEGFLRGGAAGASQAVRLPHRMQGCSQDPSYGSRGAARRKHITPDTMEEPQPNVNSIGSQGIGGVRVRRLAGRAL